MKKSKTYTSIKMLKLIICLLIYTVFVETNNVDDFVSKFNQNDYKLLFTRVEVLYIEKTLVKYLNATTFKFNRTQAVINGSAEFKVDLGYDVQFVLQAYKFASNEYRLFPLRFQLHSCVAIEHNLGGFGDALLKENKGCPLKKDVVYRLTNFYPDESKMPPFIPSGKYKVLLTFIYLDKNMTSCDVYVEVYRPMKF